MSQRQPETPIHHEFGISRTRQGGGLMNDQDRKLLDLIGQAVPQMDAAKKK